MQDLLKLAKKLIAKTIYVDLPYLTEAMVHSISDGTTVTRSVNAVKGAEFMC